MEVEYWYFRIPRLMLVDFLKEKYLEKVCLFLGKKNINIQSDFKQFGVIIIFLVMLKQMGQDLPVLI